MRISILIETFEKKYLINLSKRKDKYDLQQCDFFLKSNI